MDKEEVIPLKEGNKRGNVYHITNFPKTLPAPQSDLANQLLKDPYHLDFLAVGPDVTERQLEKSIP